MRKRQMEEKNMNEVVVYSNDLNAIILKGFTETELKLFFAICSKLKDQGTSEVRFSFEYLRELTHDRRHTSHKEYAEVIRSMYHKLIGLKFVYSNEKVEGECNLFQGYEKNLTDNSFTISVTQKFQYLFNALSSNFTIWNLDEFVELPGIYTKQIYRLLKQWRRVGHVTYKWNDFRVLLDVPESYKTVDVTRRVIKSSLDHLHELPEFADLTYNYTFSGKKIQKVSFSWTPENKEKAPQKKKAVGQDSADNAETADQNLIDLFEEEFGRKLSASEIQDLNDLYKTTERKMIIYALREDSVYRRHSMPYVQEVIRNWKKMGVTVCALDVESQTYL